MKRLTKILLIIFILMLAVNIYTRVILKKMALPKANLYFANYPKTMITKYDIRDESDIKDRREMKSLLKIGTHESEVLEELGLPESIYFEDEYEMMLNWDKNFSWNKWSSGELWDRTSPKYSFQGGSVIIIYDENRNIKELIYE